jgi:hypothetical protein
MTGYLGQYVEHPKWKISKIQISNSCGHFVEHWQREIKPNQVYCGCTVLARSSAVAMLLGISTVDPSAPSPDPSQEKRREGEVCAQGPLLVIFFPARCRPPWRRQSRPTASRSRARTPPARPRGRRAQCRSTRAPRTPTPTSFWTALPSTLWPIKGPSDQTRRRTPLPATSQTTPFHPSRSGSSTPATPARYWTSGAPPRSTTWEQAATGNRWRRRTAADSARRRRALHPPRHSLTVEHSSLQRR